MITLKNLSAAFPLLQRMFFHLQQYDAAIRYMPGKEMHLPDAPPRLSSLKQRYEIPLDLHVDYIAFSDTSLT